VIDQASSDGSGSVASVGAPPAAASEPIEPAPMLWVLGSLCQLYRIPFDAKLILQRYAPPYSLATLGEAAEALGLQVGEWRRVTEFAQVSLPSVALVKAPLPGQAANDADDVPAPALPALILKSDGTRVLYFRAGSESGETAPVADFDLVFEGMVLPVGRSPQAANEPGAEEDKPEVQPRGFGFGWFVPELLRHRKVWRDVCSLRTIQLMALATPLFTQAIIDKVIVHQTRSTLMVVAFALGMFMLFSAAMTWVRQYLVIHTGNRIDAVLGTHVFSHMLRLPVRYFEQRPTGVVVTRRMAWRRSATSCRCGRVLILDLPFWSSFWW
jgi:subfamily B ATP-binding cassette protein HlyB/CyaB